jgi:hypothetical protein
MKAAMRQKHMMKIQHRRECSQLIEEQNRLDQAARDNEQQKFFQKRSINQRLITENVHLSQEKMQRKE